MAGELTASAEALTTQLVTMLNFSLNGTRPLVNVNTEYMRAMPFIASFGFIPTDVQRLTQMSPNFNSDLKTFATTLKAKLPTIQESLKVAPAVSKRLSVVLDIMVNATSGSQDKLDKARKSLEKVTRELASTNVDIASQVSDDITVDFDQKKYFAELGEIMKRYFPDQPSMRFLNGAQSTELKGKNATDHRRYLDLRNTILKIAKDSQFKIVAENGGIMDAQEVRAKQKALGVVRSTIPAGFVGKVGPSGFFTTEGKQLDATSLNTTGFEMNKNYDPATDDTYYCKYDVLSGSVTVYTKDYARRANTEKFSVVKTAIARQYEAAEAWRSEITETSLRGVLGAMLEFTYRCACRPSTKVGNTKGQPTYGLRTFLVKHVTTYPSVIIRDENGNRLSKPKIGLSRVEVQYSGKDAQPQHHVFVGNDPVAKRVIATIFRLKAGKQPDDPLWTFNGEPISNSVFAAYVRKLFGKDSGVTPHKFRHIKGNTIAMRILENEYPFDPKLKAYTLDDVKKFFEKSMAQVGAELGHFSGGETTWRTAVENYVDPSVSREFFTRADMQVPATIDRLLRSAGAED